MSRTVVALGCSVDRDYNFLLPLTALLWRERIGHHPICLLAGSEESWRDCKRTNVAYEALVEHGIAHRFIGYAEGYPPHTTAQNCRQHAAALTQVADDDWLMPGDADLWPLWRAFYLQHASFTGRAALYYANGDHFQGKEVTLERAAAGLPCQTLPTCHAVMRGKDWREVYDVIPGDVASSTRKTLDEWFATRSKSSTHDDGMVRWMSDQQIMTEKLCRQPWFPSGAPPSGDGAHVIGEVLFINRRGHPPVDRLDRSHLHDWSTGPFQARKWTDAHMHKAPEEAAQWSATLPIVDACLPNHAEWARRYHDRYVEASQ